MNFSFSEDQLALRDQMRSFVDKECPPPALREAWTSSTGWSSRRWSALAEMGVVGLTAAETDGGLGLGLVELAVLLEEAGRVCLPEPLLETVAVGVPLLYEARGDRARRLRDRWIERVVSGEAVIAVVLAAQDAPSAAQGASVLVLDHRGEDGAVELHAVESEEVQTKVVRLLDGSARLAEVVWEPSPSSLLAAGAQAKALLDTACDRASTAAAAMLLGVADRLITMTAQHALDRKQFGKPIGSFQAVKHHLADAVVRLEFARPVVYRAGWALDEREPDASVHASMAKAQASEAALEASRVALQVHGAIGYTWEHDLHLWMKRAWSLAYAWGDARAHRARVLESMLSQATS